jgi:calpain-15
MAAIASVAEFPSFIQDELFKGETAVNEDGQYTVKLWDIGTEEGGGSWVDVTVDSLIPCKNEQFCRKPLFAGTKDNEMYMMILEKAFAKFAGNYLELKGGWAFIAWTTMTGCEKVYVFSKNEDEMWEPKMPSMEKRYEAPREFNKLYTTSTDDFEPLDGDGLWEKLKEWDESNYIMGASISGDEVEKKREDGLVERHAYSLIAAKEVGDFKLVCLRNPWGNSREWNGAWCDSSEEWENNPEVAEEVGFSKIADGKFWMSFEDFLSIWSNVCLCATEMPTRRGTH